MISMIVVMTAVLQMLHVAAEPGQCEEISIPLCKEIGYNYTRLPNQFNHETQDEVIFFIVNPYSLTFQGDLTIIF